MDICVYREKGKERETIISFLFAFSLKLDINAREIQNARDLLNSSDKAVDLSLILLYSLSYSFSFPSCYYLSYSLSYSLSP